MYVLRFRQGIFVCCRQNVCIAQILNASVKVCNMDSSESSLTTVPAGNNIPVISYGLIQSMATSTTVTLKLLIDTKGQRVLYAEAGKDFVDFLFNILLLPVGTVIRLLEKEGMVGCLANLYESVENLGDTYFQPTTNKDTLLKPNYSSSLATNVPCLLPNIQSKTTQSIYRCSNNYNYGSQCGMYYANDPTSKCPSCKNPMNSPASFVNPPNKVSTSSSDANEGGYVKGVVTYTIMDDLTVTPMSTISSITMLNNFNVQQVDALEEKVVDVSINEVRSIIPISLYVALHIGFMALVWIFVSGCGVTEGVATVQERAYQCIPYPEGWEEAL
ncbi:hypothetical protein J1N35_036518 [Gossypium stocksii]|uniref:Uncharacterized protein n=1 Tax=Gossypium stocksii TaxID=47602 RepID=A0A9D3UK94_9ROSI|nr:hypothetical protein J1N35_036518 [Gossypium stocksii]